jgi:hypothetical protein
VLLATLHRQQGRSEAAAGDHAAVREFHG